MGPVVWFALGEIAVATFLRWGVLARTAPGPRQLVLMIVGMALSEGAAFLGVFLVPASQPETRLFLFVASLLGMLQFAPVYTRPRSSNPFRARE